MAQADTGRNRNKVQAMHAHDLVVETIGSTLLLHNADTGESAIDAPEHAFYYATPRALRLAVQEAIREDWLPNEQELVALARIVLPDADKLLPREGA
jgi:hypothetical protein